MLGRYRLSLLISASGFGGMLTPRDVGMCEDLRCGGGGTATLRMCSASGVEYGTAFGRLAFGEFVVDLGVSVQSDAGVAGHCVRRFVSSTASGGLL
ncbi:hypothetical protein CH267_13450 [Rhodococcus sp. 06-621-2]|nr:hypothetical protein CH267_13450 [Rhodococcus sp. 06-621-2]